MEEENKKSKKKSCSAIARLAPNAIKTQIDGSEIIVASNRDENDALNMVVAAQLRNILQEQIKRYKEQDATLTPKDLKDLSDAARNISQFSGEIYKDATPLSEKSGPKEEKKAESVDDISFDQISAKAIDVKVEDKK